MPDAELAHLVKMINQIANNIEQGENDDETAHRVFDHVNRFWARSMKEKISAYAQDGGQGLQPIAELAVRRLI